MRSLLLLILLFGTGLWWRTSRAGRWTVRGVYVVVLVLVGFVASALSWDGSARTALLERIKRQQAQDGRLVYAERWGVVDREHVDVTREHLEQARRHLRDPATRGKPLVLVSDGATLSGTAWSTAHVYRLHDPARLEEGMLEDAARAVALQAAYDLEVEQELASWSSGLALTAWQPEDLPSALYAVCVGPNEPTVGVFDTDEIVLVGELVRRFSVRSSLRDDERASVLRARAAGALWRASSSVSLASWSDLPEGQSS